MLALIMLNLIRLSLTGFILSGLLLEASAEGNVNIELNKLEAQNNACRPYLVLNNTGTTGFTEFKLDLVLFDRDGIIARRLALDIAPLRPGKTTVKSFDITELDCAVLGRILLNDIASCRNGDNELADCLDRLTLSSRTNAKFIK
jgi:hypothetical protein